MRALRVPGLPSAGGQRAAGMPDLALALERVRVDRDRLTSYSRVCGYALRDQLPATYPHVLAFPLRLALMTDPAFPLPAIGLIHIYNRIVQHRPLGAGEELSLRLYATALRPHPRGRQFDVVTEVRAAGELVWEEVSTTLRRGRGEEQAERPWVPSAAELPATASWRAPGGLGRRYAAVSGDYNPIHLYRLSARLLGFRTAIAHGMWTLARCLAAIEPVGPPAVEIEVAFKRPVELPATVEFAEHREPDGEISFGVRDASDGTPHLDGRLGLRPPSGRAPAT